ncbi:hypothetical protein Tco_0509329 [Tanacetum coccineum]
MVLRMISEAVLQVLADLKSNLYGLRSKRFDIELCVELKYFEDCYFKTSMDPCIIPPRMMTRSAGRATDIPRGEMTGGRTCRGGGRTRVRSGNQGNGRIDGQGGQGDDKNQNGNVVNDNIQGNVRNVIMNKGRGGCSYKDFLACNPKEYDEKGGVIAYTRWVEKMESIHTWSREVAVGMAWEDFKTLIREEFCPSNEIQKLETELWNHAMVGAGHAAYTDRFHELARFEEWWRQTEPTTIQKAMQIACTLTDEAIRNGSIKKNPEKRGNGGEPSKDRNGRDDNKRTRTGNDFATTINPLRRENMGTTLNGYLRKGRKTKPKRQNQTWNGKAWKRHGQVKAQVSKSQPKSTPTNPKVNK